MKDSLKQLREALGMSQNEFAEKLRWPYSMVQGLEEEDDYVQLSDLRHLSTVLNLQLTVKFGTEPNQEGETEQWEITRKR